MRRVRWGVAGSVTLVVAAAAALLGAGPATGTAWAAPAGAAVGAPATLTPAPVVSALDPPPPGSNDWSCRPDDRHPEPVVLVHGLLANQGDNWSYISPVLAARGYCVFSLTYGRNPLAPPPLTQVGGLRKMEDSARELADFVARVRSATGAEKVDIVGHSEGSLMPDYYVKFLGGDEVVRRYVGMTPLWGGTRFYGVADLNNLATRFGLGPGVGAVVSPLCDSCREFLRGSPFLAKINSGGGPAVHGVTYTMILTSHDELVTPYTSGLLHGDDVTNIVLQKGCPNDLAEHVGVAFDPVTTQHILNALDPDHPRPVRCAPLGAPVPGGR